MIKYPTKKTNYSRQKTSHKNRGMSFEAMINEANDYYLAHDIAIIYKKPIPVQIVKVDYPSRNAAVIKEAYYKTPSTTDYNGIYKGYYIDFEAKATNNKTSFPLNNIHPHQMDHLESVSKHGAISFILIYFKVHDEIYLLETKYLKNYRERAKKGRKSIRLQEIRNNGYIVKESLSPRVAYLKVVDQIIKKG